MNQTITHLEIEQAPARLSIPRRGHVLSSVAEAFGQPIRFAVALVAAELERNGCRVSEKMTQPARIGPRAVLVDRTSAELVGWHLCTQWVVGMVLRHLPKAASLVDAAEWFSQDHRGSLAAEAAKLSIPNHSKAIASLRSIADPEALADLLPYVLDPHGPGSRLSIMRDPKTRATRDRKRSKGVFYTPADVADHMAAIALQFLTPCHPVRVFDPACGTGVYLRAALAALIKSHPDAHAFTLAQQSLFGVDVDPWAVDAAAYVLLHDVMARGHAAHTVPAIDWRFLRLNLAVADALSLDPAKATPGPENAKRADRLLHQCLGAGHLPAADAARHGPERTPINLLFPAMDKGPHVIVGNPPYAKLGNRPDIANLGSIFATLRPVTPSADMHPLFLEQMMRLSNPSASGSLVLPLSVAFNTRPQYASLRAMIGRVPGTWRFSFFDREPHALFGEDVKTRNAIASWSRAPGVSKTEIMTGPLLKWRGDSRARLLASIRFTHVMAPIANGIPKLSGILQATALDRLRATDARFASFVSSLTGSNLDHTFDAEGNTVLVGSTAYNFINVFRRPPARYKPPHSASNNTVHALRFDTVSNAHIGYAILSSRITFWLWHVLGDGFHVTKAFLEDLPINPKLFDDAATTELALIGRDLWKRVQHNPVLSCNRGRMSIAFPAIGAPDVQRRIDQLLLDATNLPKGFTDELDSFVHSVVAADPRGSTDNLTQEDCEI